MSFLAYCGHAHARKLYTSFFVLLMLTIAGLPSASANAADYQMIELNRGQTVDVYFDINLAGTVALRIATKSGPGCADLWWIKWPFGNIESLGRRCGSFRLSIPGITRFAVAAKLRASGVQRATKIITAATEQVANSVPVRW